MNEMMLNDPNGLENNVLAFVDLTLLNCKLKGVYQYQVLDPSKADSEKRTRILVIPTDPEPQGMRLTELITEVNKIITDFGGGQPVTEEDMKATLTSMGLDVFNDIEIQMRQLFIYVDKSTIAANTKPFEYALNFVILNPVKPNESLKIFHIDSLGLAVYNTKRPKIIERMKLENIDELLK